MPTQFVRVAVHCKLASDLPKAVGQVWSHGCLFHRGIWKHIIAGAGELHLEICLFEAFAGRLCGRGWDHQVWSCWVFPWDCPGEVRPCGDEQISQQAQPVSTWRQGPRKKALLRLLTWAILVQETILRIAPRSCRRSLVGTSILRRKSGVLVLRLRDPTWLWICVREFCCCWVPMGFKGRCLGWRKQERYLLWSLWCGSPCWCHSHNLWRLAHKQLSLLLISRTERVWRSRWHLYLSLRTSYKHFTVLVGATWLLCSLQPPHFVMFWIFATLD